MPGPIAVGSSTAFSAGTAAYTVDLPGGSAAGDLVIGLFAAVWTGDAFGAPALISAGITRNILNVSTGDGTLAIMLAGYALMLNAADIAAGVLTMSALHSGASWPYGSVLALRAFRNAGLRQPPSVVGAGVSVGADTAAFTGTELLGFATVYDTVGTPTDADLSDVEVIASSRVALASGLLAFASPGPASTVWVPGAADGGVPLELFAGFTVFDAVDLVINTPGALVLTGGTLLLLIPASLVIDTPGALVLTPGAPVLESVGSSATELVIDIPGALVLIGDTPTLTATADAPFELTDLSATITDHATLTLYRSLSDSAVTMHTAIGFGVDLHAGADVSAPNFIDYEPTDLRLRLMPGVYVDLPTPVISRGRPLLPAFVARLASTVTLIEGPAHIHAVPDPNPVWDPATSGWFTQPPSAGVGDQRWVVDDLPDPAPFSGQYYWLGDPSGADGTSSIPSGCRQWSPNGSTPGAPAWRSVYPYKPSVRAHVHYGGGGRVLTVTKGVRFNLQFIEHMWTDFGSGLLAPFSWVVVGIIMDFPSPGYEHTVLDVGRAPTAGGAPTLNENQLNGRHNLNENIQAGSRPAIYVGPNQQRVLADWTATKQIGSPFNFAARPKMWFGVWNGANSMAGSYSTAGKHLVGGAFPPVQQRYALLGRRGGVLSRSFASHLVVFEMRRWSSALAEQQLDAQYGQLSSTWKFGSYA